MSATHVVKQGECLTSIAARYGFGDIQWIYGAPENAAFRQLRPDPNVIMPGDEVVIPDRQPKQVTLSTNELHRMVVARPRRKIRVKLDLPAGDSLAGQRFELTAGGSVSKGTIEAENVIAADVPAQATEGTLELVDLGLTLQLAIGHLDPMHHDGGESPAASGVQARLQNLGYFGAPTGEFDDATTAALREYQRHVLGRDDPDGAPDAETLKRLLDDHGC